MLISCWSAKGGSGTTVVSVALALKLSRSGGAGALLVDLAGDGPAALGLVEPTGPGIAAWLGAGADVPADALTRLEANVSGDLSLLAQGGPLPTDVPAQKVEILADLLAADPRPVVVDCGVLGGARPSPTGTALASAATRSLLVTRACFLALRRATTLAVRPSGVVLMVEPGRALGRHDVEQVVKAPVLAEVGIDPAVARAVDAGILSARLPRMLERALRGAA